MAPVVCAHVDSLAESAGLMDVSVVVVVVATWLEVVARRAADVEVDATALSATRDVVIDVEPVDALTNLLGPLRKATTGPATSSVTANNAAAMNWARRRWSGSMTNR